MTQSENATLWCVVDGKHYHEQSSNFTFLPFFSHNGPSMVNGLNGVSISDVTSMGCVQDSKERTF